MQSKTGFEKYIYYTYSNKKPKNIILRGKNIFNFDNHAP